MSSSNPSRAYGAGSFLDLLPGQELTTLKTAAIMRVSAQGQALASQGEFAGSVIFVDSGWALESTDTDTGTETVLRLTGPGDIAGNYSALTGKTRESTIKCLSHVECAVLPAHRFTALLKKNPAMSLALSQVLEQRLEDADHRLRMQAYPGEQRLAGLLLGLSGRYASLDLNADMETLDFPLSQQQLASWAGISRQTAVRALTQWREQGLIRTTRRKIGLLDIAALHQIAADAAPTPTAPSRSASRLRAGRSIDTTIAAIGIESPGQPRTEISQEMRAALRQLLQRAFHHAGVPLADCRTKNSSHGVLIAAPPALPPQAFIGALTGGLSTELNPYRYHPGQPREIRLRIAVHAGFIHLDANEMTGRAIMHLSRMLDAPALKNGLRDGPASIAVLMSERIRKMARPAPPAGFVPTLLTGENSASTPLLWTHEPRPIRYVG